MTHDIRCEREYTKDGYIFIDCLCQMRAAMAEAWDEGFMNAASQDHPAYPRIRNYRNPYLIEEAPNPGAVGGAEAVSGAGRGGDATDVITEPQIGAEGSRESK